MSQNLTVHAVKELLKLSTYEIASSMVVILKVILPFKIAKFLGGKSANEPTHSSVMKR